VNGTNPVAMIFAREISDPLTSLVKKLDAAVTKNSKNRLGSFIVFCTDDEALKSKLEDLAKNEKIDRCILTIDNPAGPRGYKIAKDADVTVVFYKQHDVKVNRAFKKGEMKQEDVDKIVAELSKILPEK
jgi:hypothetical protein